MKALSPPDPDARFEAVMAEFGTLLRRAVASACPRDGGVQAAEIEQDARIRLWRALQSEREITDLASYIYKIAVTATIDAVRRAKARREDPLPEGPSDGGRAGESTLPSRGTSPEDEAAGRSMARAVAAAMTRLADNRRRAVGLYLQGLTTREIGNVLGWTEAKARNLAYRGLDDLRAELKRMGIEHDAG
jgi:RNA polymerase sigma factor (sigma-70 family)